jgi:hypothetical protein
MIRTGITTDRTEMKPILETLRIIATEKIIITSH